MHRKVGTHMHRWWRRIQLSIIAIIMLYVSYVLVMGVSLSYVDKMFYRIHGDAHHTEVRSMLKLFREVRVILADVPNGWREGISSIPGYEIYRYDFLGCPLLAIHVVYDKHGRVKRIIPTYE